jgi:hypothetical protein
LSFLKSAITPLLVTFVMSPEASAAVASRLVSDGFGLGLGEGVPLGDDVGLADGDGVGLPDAFA